jgi:anti-anti-sigma factor
MHIQQSARDGCIVVTLTGDLDIAAAPKVQRALLNGLAEQPDAVICDLAKVARIDPVCASVFAAVAHRPRSRWPDSSVLLCCAQPAVAAVLLRQGMPRLLPICDTLASTRRSARRIRARRSCGSGSGWYQRSTRSPRHGGSWPTCAGAGSWMR